uniref:Uncharacterized protein n=1 Tax=Mesorhizobium plurifarium TaxID=69974 RepID=I2AWI7_MESPL|nr:hypothetical protein [Mesorhizobium plurifarium]
MDKLHPYRGLIPPLARPHPLGTAVKSFRGASRRRPNRQLLGAPGSRPIG